jgi:acetyl esterase/lipase
MSRPRSVLLAAVFACCFPALLAAQPVVPQPPDGVKYCPDLVYHKTDQGPLELDLACPAGVGPFPVVVIFHGTMFTKGRKFNVPLTFELAERGYVGIVVTFRHRPENPYPEPLEDAWAAVRWVRANAAKYNMDSKRIAALGYSGGGTLACLLGMTEDPLRAKDAASSKVQAVVAYFAPTDLGQMHDDCSKDRLGYPGKLFFRPSLEKWLGGSPEKVKDRYAAASPVTHVSKAMAPLLLIHGTADTVVPVEQSRLLLDRAIVKGGMATLLQLPGARHNFDERKDANADMALQCTYMFLDHHLNAKQRLVARK